MHESYSSTEVVLAGEVFKLIVSGYLAVTDRTDTGIIYRMIQLNLYSWYYILLVGLLDAQGSGILKLAWLIRHSSKVIVLVILYALSNLLSYYALARVDASAYTVLLQVNSIIILLYINHILLLITTMLYVLLYS